jgi:hypothetical protein
MKALFDELAEGVSAIWLRTPVSRDAVCRPTAV